MVEQMKNAGFVDVKLVRKKQPLGPWPKDPQMKHAGAMALLVCETGIEAYMLQLFTDIIKIPMEEAKKLMSDGLAALKVKTSHLYNF